MDADFESILPHPVQSLGIHDGTIRERAGPVPTVAAALRAVRDEDRRRDAEAPEHRGRERLDFGVGVIDGHDKGARRREPIPPSVLEVRRQQHRPMAAPQQPRELRLETIDRDDESRCRAGCRNERVVEQDCRSVGHRRKLLRHHR